MLAAGDVLDQTYEVDGVLGQGGMGVVYRVRHRALARAFAAKLIHARVADAPAFLERFTREAEALGKLKHPHIVDVTDFGIDRGRTARPYLVMEYLAGRTLEEQIRSGALAADAALLLFEGIAAALDYAHEQGVLHLDLKPGNILVLDTPGGRSSAKILDFGLAQFLTSPSADPVREPAVRADRNTSVYGSRAVARRSAGTGRRHLCAWRSDVRGSGRPSGRFRARRQKLRGRFVTPRRHCRRASTRVFPAKLTEHCWRFWRSSRAPGRPPRSRPSIWSARRASRRGKGTGDGSRPRGASSQRFPSPLR